VSQEIIFFHHITPTLPLNFMLLYLCVSITCISHFGKKKKTHHKEDKIKIKKEEQE